MSLDAFLGTWREDKKEGFEQLAQSIRLSQDKVDFYKQAVTEISYSRNGDQWTIDVGIVGVPNGSRVFKFMLNEPYNSVNIDGTPLKSIIRFDGSGFVEQHTPEDNKESEMKILRKVDGDKMEVETTMGGATMKSYYKKIKPPAE